MSTEDEKARTFVCSQCNTRFGQKSNLMTHLHVIHLRKDKPPALKQQDDGHQANICDTDEVQGQYSPKSTIINTSGHQKSTTLAADDTLKKPTTRIWEL
jgi:hypothetical protein